MNISPNLTQQQIFLQIKYQELAYAEKHGLDSLKAALLQSIESIKVKVEGDKQLKLFK